MNLLNKKILNQRIANFSFPKGEDAENISKLITGWQKALKDSDLSKTKEKSIQGKFLNVFFEQILGYEDKTGGLEEWSLIAEPKTEVDSQVADGSLGFFTKDKKETKAVIELKDAKTSLDKKQKGREKGYSPVEQGYLYATKFDRCKWIIVSNFREIRLYNKARSEQFYEKFDVLDLHKEDEFKKFYFLLKKENLISKEGDSPIDDLAKKSTDQEEDISKKFYSDYKEVRTALYNHLSKENKNLDKKTLFEKSQKILDRIVFILFCEDTANLLPKNLLKETYEFGKRSRQRSDEKVWLEMKNLFIDIDEGRQDIDPKINGYNGGLFKFDEILDNLHIKDDIWDSVIKLSDYDFETDLNVNILGHIFEQSISDIENLKAELEDTEQDKSKSKRKKDGIFYTPEYITKYIVENTVGKYLEENPDKLESIKILDPACGSGAFLNQAHSYLINEYKVRHEQKLLEKEKKGEALTLFDYNPAEANRAILLNNLYGVDLNDESVEITKLSLWLKTARKDEPLQNLDNNIKVGNSLIDDPEVAGEKAFDWKKEYKDIMKDGGFDVIIGNPPYVQLSKIDSTTDKEKEYLVAEYDTSAGRLNTFAFFILLAIKLLNKNGILGFIIPNTILTQSYYEKVREVILKNSEILELVNYDELPFSDAVVENITIIIRKKNNATDNVVSIVDSYGIEHKIRKSILQSTFLNNYKLAFNFRGNEVTDKIADRAKYKFSEILHINQGIAIKGNRKSSITNDTNKQSTNSYYRVIDGKHINRYALNWGGDWLHYDNKMIHSGGSKDKFLVKSKILFRRVSTNLIATIDSQQYFALNTLVVMTPKETSPIGIPLEIILALFNSKLTNYYYSKIFKSTKKVFSEIQAKSVGELPIPGMEEVDQDFLIGLVHKIMKLKQEILEKKEAFSEIFTSTYEISFPNSMDAYKFGWNELLELFEKNKQNLSLEQKEELQNWFKKKQKELQDLQNEIDKLDREIDQEVYKLYGLTQEEINVIEGFSE